MLDNYITVNREYPQFYIVKCSREGEDSQLHSPVISRLGEIYLNRAEALAKLGNYAEAEKDLNKIRGRAIVGGEYPTGTLNANNAFTLIDKERQLEVGLPGRAQLRRIPQRSCSDTRLSGPAQPA